MTHHNSGNVYTVNVQKTMNIDSAQYLKLYLKLNFVTNIISQ